MNIAALPTPYYQDDAVVIYHADCRDILPLIDPALFGLMLTDPPYGIGYCSGQVGTSWWHGRQIANDSNTDDREYALSWWGGRPALIFGTWKVAHPASTRMVLVWDKGPALGMGPLDIPWKPSWEQIYVMGNGFVGHRGGGVLYCPPVQSMAKNGRVHPNEKPISLIRELLLKHPAEKVIDPFMGSGTTLRAAKDLGRRAIGIEIEERFCEIAAKRMAQTVLPLGELA